MIFLSPDLNRVAIFILEVRVVDKDAHDMLVVDTLQSLSDDTTVLNALSLLALREDGITCGMWVDVLDREGQVVLEGGRHSALLPMAQRGERHEGDGQHARGDRVLRRGVPAGASRGRERNVCVWVGVGGWGSKVRGVVERGASAAS